MVAGTPRVFVSHLSGVAAFDPNGDEVGRVRDVVVMLRVGGRPPRVLGLVVEVVGRRRIFLPMTRVTGVEAGQVITTGVLNVRRFEQRPTETLVLGELLDRRVRWMPDGGAAEGAVEGAATGEDAGEEVTVLDVSMAQLPARRDWEIDKVFIRRGKPGALRRKGETLTVDWSSVSGFRLPEGEQGAENLVATFEQLRPADLANVLHHLSPKRRGEVAAALDDDRLADALARIRNPDLSPALAAQIYVCRPPDQTPTGKYLGLVHFQRLLRDPPFTLLGAIVDTDLRPLAPDTALPSVTSFLATYNMISAPVVDESGALLGAVTVDDVLDHLLPEDWRETELHGAGPAADTTAEVDDGR
jgi:CBS domain-containing protein/sporulation protein YlmC with PRC-barrel domain